MNKSKIKTCRKKDLSSLEKLKSWLDSHKIIGFFLILGLILLCKDLPLPGVILALVGLSVLMISASILRLLSLVDNPWMTKYRKRCGKRC